MPFFSAYCRHGTHVSRTCYYCENISLRTSETKARKRSAWLASERARQAANEAARRERRRQRHAAVAGLAADFYDAHRQQRASQRQEATAQVERDQAAWEEMLDARTEFSVSATQSFAEQIDDFEARLISEVAARDALQCYGEGFSAEQYEAVWWTIHTGREAHLEAKSAACAADTAQRRQWLAAPEEASSGAADRRTGLLARAAADMAHTVGMFSAEYSDLQQVSAQTIPTLFRQVIVGAGQVMTELLGADHVVAGTWMLSWVSYPQRLVRDTFTMLLPRWGAEEGLRSIVGARMITEVTRACPALFLTDASGLSWRLRLEDHPSGDVIRPLCQHGYPHRDLVGRAGDLVSHDAASYNEDCPLCTQATHIYAHPPTRFPTAGWLADPLGVHELRWWTGSSWTDLVNDRGVAGSSIIPTPWLPSLYNPSLVHCI